MKRILSITLLILIAATSVALAGWREDAARAMQSGDYAAAEQILTDRLSKKASDPVAHRELGIVHYKQERFAAAELQLGQADSLKPRDERTVMYRGLTLEKIGRFEDAVKIYSTVDTPAMRARTELASNESVRKSIAAALESEAKGAEIGVVGERGDSTIAATEFSTVDLPDSLKPLGRGMSALISSDLAQLTPFTVLERTRLQPLFDELALRKYELTDSLKQEKIGTVMGAEMLTTGQLFMGQSILAARGQIVDVPEGTPHFSGQAEGAVSSFYSIEKNLVSQMLNALGVTLDSRGERALASVPTQSLDALLAYSEGLEKWDHGDSTSRAASLIAFQRALQLDPGFTMARNDMEWRSVILSAGNDPGNYEEFVQAGQLSGKETGSGEVPKLAMRDLLNNVNPNHIAVTGAAGEPSSLDPRDVPYADQYGPWVTVPIQPERP